MLYAVIDTNVIISAALAKDRSQSVPFSILQAAITKKYIPLVDSLIIEEYKEVLYRPKFHLENTANDILESFLKNAIHVIPTPSFIKLPDKDDVVFYDVMQASKERQTYLVTGNIKHFPKIPFIVTPREFLNILETQASDTIAETKTFYDPTGLLAALCKANDNALKNGTAGMSEEEIEKEIQAMHSKRNLKRKRDK